jgi:hypothetical protein
MGYSTQQISKADAQQIIRTRAKDCTEASDARYLGAGMVNVFKQGSIQAMAAWRKVSGIEHGDNARLYITFKDGGFMVIELERA